MLIIGGGLLSAYRLERAGVRCALIEAERICGGWDALAAFVRESYPGASGVRRRATQGLHDARRQTLHRAVCREHAGAVRGDGFSRWGMTTSVAVANLLSDLLQGRENRAAALFSPARSMLRLRLLKNGGEAGTGQLTPTRTRYPHMGCALKWNLQERTRDCACHGSRFSREGELLNNPATWDLSAAAGRETGR